MMDPFLKYNKDNWNDRTSIHKSSPEYDLVSFLSGKSSLKSVELNEIGDLTDKTMLHLQCHFGQDTLSWARMGVKATGVDFSEEAISLARTLNDELGLQTRFICSNIYDIPLVMGAELFDIVFTSYGVLCWLPDLNQWAQIIYDRLRAGGIFYIVEAHPLANIYEVEHGQLIMDLSYFHKGPLRFESDYSYVTSQEKLTNNVNYEWIHSLSDIVNALIGAGLCIEFMHEFPFCMYEKFPGCMTQDEDGWWKLKDHNYLPMLFSLKATKKG